jgi:hypothetical protein
MRAAWALLASVLLVAACAQDNAESDDVADGADALSSNAIASYAPVAPPETRVATAAIPVQLGAPIAEGARLSVIRTLLFQNVPAKVVVDADSYVTSLVAASALASGSEANAFIDAPYEKSLASLADGSSALSHIGPEAPIAAPEQFALTIDMCQSSKPWEKRLFDWIVSLSNQLHQPIPIGIAMTGVWAKAHPTELDQLNAWQAQGKLAITWMNHSSTHPLFCQDHACVHGLFLTEPHVDMDEEVMGLERSLLAGGMMPSAIFRFPGLVHNQERLKQLSRLSLLPLDADAWLALGQKIHQNAVVLVHGNGNEPEGIALFLKAVTTTPRVNDLATGKSKIVPPILAAPSQR